MHAMLRKVSSEVDEKKQLLNFVFQNLELKDKKLSVTLREPFKIIKDTSQLEKCPGMCRSQDSFRTFKEFDWGQIEQKLTYFNKSLSDRNLMLLQ